MNNLKGKDIAIIVGHEAGGGADGEREFNIPISIIMRDYLEARGANVYLHKHRRKNYSMRMIEMRSAIKSEMPSCDVCVELHYNAYNKPSAHGHEFLYRGSKRLAECVRDEFQASFPNSTPRGDNGIKYTPHGRGAGFLRQSPGWALIVEPFFATNPDEFDHFSGRQTCLAESYCRGVNKYFQ